MASATRIIISPETRGVFHVQKDPKAAETVSELLQLNMERWHMIFYARRHNHMVHALLSAYALGASSDTLRMIYARESLYQVPAYPVNESHVNEMKDKGRFKEYLDKPEHYSSFLRFFQREIEAKGVPAVLNEHLFANGEHAQRMFGRFFSALLHSIIHMGFALEFDQPALVAESLAQAAMHDEAVVDKQTDLLLEAEKQSAGIGKPGQKTFVEIMNEMREDDELRESHCGKEPGMRVRNVIDNAPQKFIKYAKQYTVSDDQLEDRMLEILTATPALIAPAKDQSKKYKVDFGLLHAVNASTWLPVYQKLDWISTHNKLRLFEWIGRNWLLLIVSQGSPRFEVDSVSSPMKDEKDWPELFSKTVNHPTDDGHLMKLIRILALGSEIIKKDTGKKFLVNGSMWLTQANIAFDSVSNAETSEDRWRY